MVSKLYASFCNKSKAIDPPAKPAMDAACKLIFQKVVIKNKTPNKTNPPNKKEINGSIKKDKF